MRIGITTRTRKLHCVIWIVTAYFAMWVSLGSVASGQATQTIPLSDGPVLAGQTFYGVGIAMDDLANTTLDHSSNSYRFRSAHSGQLSSIRFFLVLNQRGYAGGNNGTVRVEIQTDDGTSAHNPSGRALAAYTIPNASLTTFPLVTFQSPPTLQQGSLYHAVFSNTDPNPTINYCSIDALLNSLSNPPTPAQPTVSDTDWIQLIRSDGGSWRVRPGYSPILQLNYSDGFVSGLGYMESWIASTKTIHGAFRVRETFTISGADRTARKVFLRVRSGSGGLTVRLEHGDGTLMEQGTMSSTPTGNNWLTYTFAEPQTLQVGQSFNLVFSSPTGSYDLFPVRRGSAYGFSPHTYFSDGVAQYNSGTGWVGWDAWGVTNRREQDLQFYFVLEAPGQLSGPVPPTGLQITVQ